ncbi:hypothetical protein A3731_36150 [Roseovarius sp. HI0049]|nr:hypothetical protein A3731_02555 [Roseovarius sp. HI0049]KZY41405.1 hypothetical protein A3731_36150 [Roseovarius sp. HI0049]
MKRTLIICLLAAGLALSAAASAQAACSVEYKAKRDNPLELFFEVAVVPGPCNPATAEAQLRPILAGKGLTLLKIVSVREE